MNAVDYFDFTKGELECVIQDKMDDIEKLSNHLNAALKLLEVYRETYGFLRHHKIEEAEFTYAKAISEGELK